MIRLGPSPERDAHRPAPAVGAWGYVVVAVRADDTRELRPAYVDDVGTVVYSPDIVAAWRDASDVVAASWIHHHDADAWRPWVPADHPGTVVVDGPTFPATRLELCPLCRGPRRLEHDPADGTPHAWCGRCSDGTPLQ